MRRVMRLLGVVTLLAASTASAQAADKPSSDSLTGGGARGTNSTKYAQWLSWKDKVGFQLMPFGYVRASYESVENDDKNGVRVGHNDGFVLDNARAGLDFTLGEEFSGRISVEAATDVHKDTNSAFGEIDVRLRDGFARYDPCTFFGVQVGQFKVPFAAEELRSTADLLFINRAVGQEGVPVGRGYEEDGVALDRQLGVMLAPISPISFGDFGLGYYFNVSNGNGSNQLLNDNSKVAVVGRMEMLYSKYVTVGAAGMWNKRGVGNPPNQYDEEDTGYATDLLLTAWGGEIFFQWVDINTDFHTVNTDDRERRAWHVQIGYPFPTPWPVTIEPAYRFAQYQPWADDSDQIANHDADDYDLNYHTFGIKLAHTELPVALYFNYTITKEPNARSLNNDRVQVLAQVEF